MPVFVPCFVDVLHSFSDRKSLDLQGFLVLVVRSSAGWRDLLPYPLHSVMPLLPAVEISKFLGLGYLANKVLLTAAEILVAVPLTVVEDELDVTVAALD